MYKQTYFDVVSQIKETAQDFEASGRNFKYTRAVEELYSRKINWDTSLPRCTTFDANWRFIRFCNQQSHFDETFISLQREGVEITRRIIDQYGHLPGRSEMSTLFWLSRTNHLDSLQHRFHETYSKIIPQIKQSIRDFEATGRDFNYTHAVEELYSRKINWNTSCNMSGL
jgi:hypothetical protein